MDFNGILLSGKARYSWLGLCISCPGPELPFLQVALALSSKQLHLEMLIATSWVSFSGHLHRREFLSVCTEFYLVNVAARLWVAPATPAPSHVSLCCSPLE